MNVAVIHPLKHHAYYSMAGVMESGENVIGLFGYYDKGDLLDKLVSRTKWKKQLAGYKYDKISNYVKTNLIIKFLFLLAKAKPQYFQRIYDWAFETWAIHNLKDIDCIHVLQDYENRLIRASKEKNIKIVYEQILAYCAERYVNVDAALEDKNQKENLKMADYILVASEFVKDSIVEMNDAADIDGKITIIPYGADIQHFSYKERAYVKGGELKLFTVASVSRRKGMDYLLEAMEKMKNLPVKLFIVGALSAKEQYLAEKMHVMKNVEYLGVIPHEQISAYYEKYDVFILPSLAEGSSLSIYEALSSGMPCIVTKNAGSVVVNEIDGFIVDVKSTESIISAVNKMLDCPELVMNMSLNARETIKKYTWDEYEKKVALLYQSMV